MNILVAFLIFGFIVFVHELGHYVMARKNGILVEEFAIGMGPKLYGKKVGETVYSIRVFPIGGFCKMLGEDENNDDERAFSSKKPWQKIQAVLGGPVFNFILAFVFGMIFVGLAGSLQPVIKEVVADMPAAQAGLLPGDRIIKVDGHLISNYKEISIYLGQSKGTEMTMLIKRAGEKMTIHVTPVFTQDTQSYRIGMSYEPVNMKNPLNLVKYGFLEMVFWIKVVFLSLGMMIGGQVSKDDVSGPVGLVSFISQGYAESVKYGVKTAVMQICYFIVLLSANLGVMNLLPLPALDGGRLIFLFIEAVRGKPVDQNKEGLVHFAGFVILMGLMLLITYNDIIKLFK